MKSLLSGLLIISSLQIARAAEPTPIEQRVVELRITRQEFEPTNTRLKKSKRDFGQGVCSGSFIDSSGDILTAGHCAAGASSIDVITYDGQRYAAVIVATSSTHDLALLHIDRVGTAAFAPAKQIVRGEKIFILGSPLAMSNTLSTGVIAKLNGDHTLLDCGALPGNSGSAVYDENGDMVGVLTAGYIVGMGTTHLNEAQSLTAVEFFLARAARGEHQ